MRSSHSGGDNMYTMMKPVPGGNIPSVSIVLSWYLELCSRDQGWANLEVGGLDQIMHDSASILWME